MKAFAPGVSLCVSMGQGITQLLEPAAHNLSAPSLRLAPRSVTPIAVNHELPRVCIIGAGASGIAMAKTLYQAGVPFDCFETSDRVGGLWVFKNKSGKSAAYRSLHANTSRDRSSYSDFPFPRNWPSFPHHTQLAQYFDAYVDWFGFRHKIHFERTVERVRQRDDAVWEVSLENGETRRYDAVCVASGQFWNPVWPDPRPPGRFAGVEIHAKDYVDPTEPLALRGKRALVVGFGNSALDIACELGRKENCEMVYVSTRRGRWVIPRQFGARTWDAFYPHPALQSLGSSSRSLRAVVRSLAPRRMREWIRLWRLEAAAGLPHQHGLPQPAESYFDAWPVISSELYQRIAAGDLAVKPEVASYDGRVVHFTDGDSAEVDAIIYCTGYKRSFPFFEQSFAEKRQDSTSRWMQIADPERKNLFFIGFTNPGCAVMPMSEQQAIFVRDILLDRFAPPSPEAMRQELSDVSGRMRQGGEFPRWYAENIDCAAYVAALRRIARDRGLQHTPGAANGIRNRSNAAASVEEDHHVGVL